jgi:hypothetical protein
MSKKILKLAGRRPMLLVIIVMATLTLGLLFSGWLTPMPIKAQAAMAHSRMLKPPTALSPALPQIA